MRELFVLYGLFLQFYFGLTDATPSLFRKLVNMFTPTEQRVRLEQDEKENGRTEPAKAPKGRRRLSNQKSSKFDIHIGMSRPNSFINVSTDIHNVARMKI